MHTQSKSRWARSDDLIFSKKLNFSFIHSQIKDFQKGSKLIKIINYPSSSMLHTIYLSEIAQKLILLTD